jgi:hypothetical protein
MRGLATQRCFHHAGREAAARCTGCGRYYCRECVSEHDARVLCATCLRKLTERPASERRGYANALRGLGGVMGLLVAWFFFYLIGVGLLNLPTSFHEGTLWRVDWLEAE